MRVQGHNEITTNSEPSVHLLVVLNLLLERNNDFIKECTRAESVQ